FLTKNPARRLGCMAEEGGENAKTAEDVNNFDPDFTQEEPTLTPIEDLLPSVNQDEFHNFSFTAPELLDD
ncbi:unnamed protein product, partial [Coregonus sp. 'balchen']